MKTKHNTLYLGLLLINLLFTVTAWKTDDPFSKLQTQISKIDLRPVNASRKVYLVLPNQGCEGCISTVEDFALKNYNNKNLYLIFTRVNSPKLLKIKLTDKVLKHPHVFVDKKDVIAYPKADMQIYPMIVYVENNKIIGVDYESPATDGIRNLRVYGQRYFNKDDQIL